MSRNACTAVYAFEGTAALAALAARPARRLTLVEGGLGRKGAAPAPRAGRLDALQLVFAVLAGAAVVAAIVLASALSDLAISSSRARALEDVATTTVTVSEGDSLWGIAAERPVEGVETADLVRWIADANSLDGASLRPGQSLVVPARG